MTIQRRMLPKVQPATMRKSKTAKKPKVKEGFPKSVIDAVEKRSGGTCELDSCGPAEVHHHRRPRGKGGTSLLWVNQAANDFHVSNSCHALIESGRMKSYVNGWLVSMLGDRRSADVPVLYRGQWVLLRDAGMPKPLVADGDGRPVEGDDWDVSEALS